MHWPSHVTTVCSKANRTLGYIRRCSAEIGSLNARRTLYISLVRSLFSYGSQLWAPQKIKYINMMERVQRRATKFLLKLPFRTNVLYQKRLLKLGLLPITYWLEILDLVLYFRTLKGETFPENHGLVQIKQQIRFTRHNNTQSGVLTEIPRAKTVSFQNSFFVRTSRIWNSLTPDERDLSLSAATFKRSLMRKYNGLLRDVYDPDNAVTFKSNCVKCHVNRNLSHVLQKPCCF